MSDESKLKPERVTVLMEPDFLKEIERFQHAHLIQNRSEAILAMLKFALSYPGEAVKFVEPRKKR